MKTLRFLLLALFLLPLFLQGQNAGAPQTASPGNVDWPVYNGGLDGEHYSTLSQINRDNVSKLQVAWTFDAGDAYPSSEMECNPLIVHGVLYATTPKVNVIALNAATGKLIWRFDPNVDPKDPSHHLRIIGKMRSRGVAYWSDSSAQRIFATARQYLYSLDAQTGKPDPAFGEGGRIDLRKDLGPDSSFWVTMTTPGIVYKDMLIIGSTVAEALPAALGDIRAYDVHSGKLRWSFHTIPRPGEFGYDTWPKDAWKYIGSANDWSGLTLDPKRGLVFAGTGSAASDFYGANRTGDNLFANSELALKADTGERVWHYQTVHHDIWDRDLPAPPTLVTVTRDGHPVDAVAQTTKSGFVFLFDRETGAPLFPIESKKYPPSDVEGEVTAATQPLPTIPEPFARQKLTADMLTERTPQAHADALARFQKLRSDGQFIPGSREGTIIFPGYDGGAEWGGPAYDPESHLLYVNENEMAWVLRLVEQTPPAKVVSGKDIYMHQCAACHRQNMRGSPPEFPSLVGLSMRYSDEDVARMIYDGGGRMPGFARLGHDSIRALVDYVYYGKQKKVKSKGPSPYDLKYAPDGYNKFLDIDGYPAIQPPWGTLNAINLDTGKFAWKLPLGDYPELAAQGMTNTGSENYGGPVVTAGGLLFIAATSYDKKIRAFDKENGKLLWEATLPAAGNATPSTYEVNGRQFLVIAAGGGKSKDPSGSSIVAFALPQ
ncbi:MAG TPA: PQQ-binding-like beta-propeller repeat protein [Terriglobales bacterium]|nr:PQQ-binding-like beta-propeller repeat protein [Terriglobales bacterium]